MQNLASIDKIKLDGLDFCSEAYRIHRQITSEKDGFKKLLTRETDEHKKLIEEVFPLCRYIQKIYRPGLRVFITWSSGDQSYDAELAFEGGFVENDFHMKSKFLEVTTVSHPKDFLLREAQSKDQTTFGVLGLQRLTKPKRVESKATACDGFELFEFAGYAAKAIEKKAKIKYPNNTTLVLNCVSSRAMFFPYEWQNIVVEMQKRKLEHNFQEIVVISESCDFHQSIFPS